jgi:hypothetical protein
MVQVYMILSGRDTVSRDSWFKMMQDGERVPLNILAQNARLDMRRNFFTHRVVEYCNKIPADLKKAETINYF